MFLFEPSFISLFLSLFMGSLHPLKCASASLQRCLTCCSVPAMSLHWHRDSGRGFTFNFAENIALSGAMFSVRKCTVSAGLSWSDVSSHYCHFLRPLRPSSLTVNTGVWHGCIVGRGALPSPAFCRIVKQNPYLGSCCPRTRVPDMFTSLLPLLGVRWFSRARPSSQAKGTVLSFACCPFWFPLLWLASRSQWPFFSWNFRFSYWFLVVLVSSSFTCIVNIPRGLNTHF